VRARVGLKEDSLARAIGLGPGSGFGLGSDVCQGGGDRIVTLKVVFSHFHLVGERCKVRVSIGLWIKDGSLARAIGLGLGLGRVHWPVLSGYGYGYGYGQG